jgi:hypothetical protein
MYTRETQKELRTVLQRVPKYNNFENEDAVIAYCRAEGKVITIQNVVEAFSRLRDAGRLKVNENTSKVVKAFLDALPKYRGVNANETMLAAAFEENKPMELQDVFNRIKHQLVINNEYAQAYQEFFQKHPELALEANVSILDGALLQHGEAITTENFEELLLPGNPRNVLGQLGITTEARQAQADARETERMISEISGYMLDANGKVKREFTHRQYNDKIAGLRAMPFSALVARYETGMTAR